MKFIIFLLLIFASEVGSQRIYKRLHIYVHSFSHLTRRFPSHKCCWEEQDLPRCSNCGIRYSSITTLGQRDLGFDFRQEDTFNFNREHVIDFMATERCMNLSINVGEYASANTIDLWRITCLDLPTGENYTVHNNLGLFRNMAGRFDLWWECDGYAGPNCIKECTPNSRSYCDRDGNLHCIAGFANPPSCTLNSPCVSRPCRNDGICQAISTLEYRCICDPLHSGKNCENPRCDPKRCAGTCENGECVCTALQIDPSCTTHSCEGNFLCRNNGTCVSDDDHVSCHCPAHTSGTYCQYHCDPDCINGRCGNDLDGNSVCVCFPNFGGPRCETKIDITPEFGNRRSGLARGAVAGITIVVILIVISICLIVIIIKFKHKFTIFTKNFQGSSGKLYQDPDGSSMERTNT